MIYQSCIVHVWEVALVTTLAVFSIRGAAKTRTAPPYGALAFLVAYGVFVHAVHMLYPEVLKACDTLKCGLIQLVFEAACWCLVAHCWAKSEIHWRPGRLLEDAVEMKIFWAGVLIGVIHVLYLACHNANYLIPADHYGMLRDIYYNADTQRAVTTATMAQPQYAIHATYRFLLLPLTLWFFPVTMPLAFLPIPFRYASLCTAVLAYWMSLIQIGLMSASAVLLYRLIKGNGLYKTAAMCGALLYLTSFTLLWGMLIPETFTVSLFFLLLTLLLFQKAHPARYVCAVAAATSNPITGVIFIPCICNDLYRHRDKLVRHMRGHTIVIGAAIVCASFLLASITLYVFLPYVQRFSIGDIQIWNSLTFVVAPWLWAPSSIYEKPFIFQDGTASFCGIILFISIVCLCVIGAIERAVHKNREDTALWSAVVTVAAGFIFHGIIGFSRYAAALFSPLYGWAVVFLVACAFGRLITSFPRAGRYAFIIFGISLLVLNEGWLIRLARHLEGMSFERYSAGRIYMSVDSISGKVSLPTAAGERTYTVQPHGILAEDGSEVLRLKNTCNYRVSTDGRAVVGVTGDGTWFYLKSDGKQAHLVQNGKEIELAGK